MHFLLVYDGSGKSIEACFFSKPFDTKIYTHQVLKLYGFVAWNQKFNVLQITLCQSPEVVLDDYDNTTGNLGENSVQLELRETAKTLEFRRNVLSKEWVLKEDNDDDNNSTLGPDITNPDTSVFRFSKQPPLPLPLRLQPDNAAYFESKSDKIVELKTETRFPVLVELDQTGVYSEEEGDDQNGGGGSNQDNAWPVSSPGRLEYKIKEEELSEQEVESCAVLVRGKDDDGSNGELDRGLNVDVDHESAHSVTVNDKAKANHQADMDILESQLSPLDMENFISEPNFDNDDDSKEASVGLGATSKVLHVPSTPELGSSPLELIDFEPDSPTSPQTSGQPSIQNDATMQNSTTAVKRSISVAHGIQKPGIYDDIKNDYQYTPSTKGESTSIPPLKQQKLKPSDDPTPTTSQPISSAPIYSPNWPSDDDDDGSDTSAPPLPATTTTTLVEENNELSSIKSTTLSKDQVQFSISTSQATVGTVNSMELPESPSTHDLESSFVDWDDSESEAIPNKPSHTLHDNAAATADNNSLNLNIGLNNSSQNYTRTSDIFEDDDDELEACLLVPFDSDSESDVKSAPPVPSSAPPSSFPVAPPSSLPSAPPSSFPSMSINAVDMEIELEDIGDDFISDAFVSESEEVQEQPQEQHQVKRSVQDQVQRQEYHQVQSQPQLPDFDSKEFGSDTFMSGKENSKIKSIPNPKIDIKPSRQTLEKYSSQFAPTQELSNTPTRVPDIGLAVLDSSDDSDDNSDHNNNESSTIEIPVILSQVGSATYACLKYSVCTFINTSPNHSSFIDDILSQPKLLKYTNRVIRFDKARLQKRFGITYTYELEPLEQCVKILGGALSDLETAGLIMLKTAPSKPATITAGNGGGSQYYEGIGKWNLGKIIQSIISSNQKRISLTHVITLVGQNKRLRGHFVSPRAIEDTIDEMLGTHKDVWAKNTITRCWINKGDGY